MTSRFGRNQKRAMRQQIEVLTKRVEAERHTYEELAATVDYTTRVLGANSVALPPSYLGDCYDSSDTFNVPRMRRLEQFDVNLPPNAVVSRALELIELQVMCGAVEFDKYRQEIHGYVKVNGKEAYACSQLGALSIPPEFIARELAGLLEPLISRELQKC